MSDLHFLFLQGLPSPFFSRIANELTALGAKTTGINLCFGDTVFWRGPNTINYRGSLSAWPSYITHFLAEHNITDIILLGEQRSYHKYAIEAAKARSIRVTVTDFGYLRPDWITLEVDGMSGNSKFPKDLNTLMNLADQAAAIDLEPRYSDSFSTMAKGDMVYHLGNFFLWWLFPFYRRPYKRDHPILHYPAIGKRILLAKMAYKHAQRRLLELRSENKRYFLFPLQLENDFQIVAYSPFDSLEEAIHLVIKSFATYSDNDTYLLVKVHPLDPGLKNWKRRVHRLSNQYGVGGRIEYFDGGNLDDIILGSQGMITINSTAAIRALQLGCAVMALGDAVYNFSELTYQGHIDQYWQNAESPDKARVHDFVKALASSIQIRGVFYNEPGLSSAVNEAVYRLYNGKVGRIIN